MSGRIKEALRILGWTEKYKAKFEEEDVDDEIIDAWLEKPLEFKELDKIIPTSGARTRFLLKFQSLSSMNGDQINCKAPDLVPEANEISAASPSNSVAVNSSASAIHKQAEKKLPPSFQLPAHPEPIQIIEFKETTQDSKTTQESSLELVFYKERLQTILNKVGQRQIAILSIAGPSRKGKSFILDFMLRYLKSIQKSNENDEDNDVTSDWMGWKTPDEPLKGFSWRNGYEPETNGILMWSEPLNVTSCDGREFSIILMDTQGVFDEHTSTREWSTIVGLSLLTSSCLIFNIFNDLQEDVLQSLENFMAFGLLAVDQQENEDENKTTIKPYQRLNFLIRDWNNPGEFPYGEKGGKKFLDKKLEIKPSHQEYQKRVRQQLAQCFDQIDCFLMPEPGEAAKMLEFSGCLSELDSKFSSNVEKFISSLLNIDNFPTKSIGGNVVTGVELFTYFENYVEIFKSEETPKPKALFDVAKMAFYGSLVDKTFTLYLNEISTEMKSKQFFSNQGLQAIHNSAVEKAIEFFGKSRKIGNLEDSQLNKEKVEGKIKEQFDKIQERNIRERELAGAEAFKESLSKFQEIIKMKIQNPNIDPNDCLDEETVENCIKAAQQSARQRFYETLGIQNESEESHHDFQAQQTQLESSMSKLVKRLQQTNQLQRSRSEATLQVEIEKIMQDYMEKVQSQIGRNYIPAKELERILQSATEESLKSFQHRSQFSLYQKFKEKLLEQIQREEDEITTIVVNKGALLIQKVEQKYMEIVHQSREKLNQVRGTDLEKFTKAYENYRENITQEFEHFLQNSFFGCTENDSKDDISTSNSEETIHLKNQYADKFLHKIQEIFEEIKSQLVLLESLIKSMRDKESEAITIYTTAMENFLQDNEACPEDQLESIHTREKATAELFLSSAIDEIIQPLKSLQDTESDAENPRNEISEYITNKMNETRKNFDDNCEQQIQDYKDRSKLQETKARNELSSVKSHYSSKLKTIADLATTLEEFDKLAANAKEDKKKQLESTLDKKLSPILKEKLFQELQQTMTNCYEETLEYFTMKLEEDNITIENALVTARKHYNSEMEKYLSSTSTFVHPKTLEEVSERTMDAAVQLSKQNIILTPSQEQQVRKKMTPCFLKFHDQNCMKVPMNNIAIGIDLGTTYCCVAAFLNGSIKIIPNTQGQKTTPSYVSFAPDGSWCVGQPAKEKAPRDPHNTIFDAKRLIGRKFDDPVVQKDIKLWPFKVVNENGVVQIKAQGKLYHPEQISSFILAYLKECAEKYLGVQVKKAVITVPAYFKDGQKEATRHAGELAGLEVLKIINEPTAAAMAYKLEYADESHKKVLIFDLGGGTFDVAAVTITGGNLEVKALHGDTHLGGVDFDNEMVSFCVDSFKAQTGIDLKDESKFRDQIYRNLTRMRIVCESKKIILSAAQRETVVVDVVTPEHDLSVDITRKQFEEMNQGRFDRCLEIVDKLLKDAGLTKGQIDDIVMVGGSTRIPKIQEMLRAHFGGKALNYRIDADEAVAVGAAMQAASLNAKQGDYFKKIISSINDVTPHSIGVEISDLTLSVIIPKNSRIPCREIRPYTTYKDNQTLVDVKIFEGEKVVAAENPELGVFKLDGIPAAKQGEEIVDVAMEIDVDGLLTVTATSRTCRKTANITVSTLKGRLDRALIQQLRDSTAEQMKNRRESTKDVTADDGGSSSDSSDYD